MSIDRRKFLVAAIVAVGGATALSSCSEPEAIIIPTDDVESGLRFYTEDEYKLLNRFADILIPETSSVGAIRAGVPSYMDGLMADWASDATRLRHRAFLSELSNQLQGLAKRDFLKVSQENALQTIKDFDELAFAEPKNFSDYIGFKDLLATVYSTTELGAEATGWSYAPPGYWDPNVPKDYS
ncbi:gluconate 2-dehydrogenase subunit 3 family protein [Hirschia maritima]|uniref:gluconate 2-dehydrogenase subunit 3 family protein n=1 Tax=Hirschia maritima TaxID=1121961 RepID=UPI000372C7B1|nr:gluconate 2-dehydrogenase subunit 3 family protein [Hirschia maritima]